MYIVVSEKDDLFICHLFICKRDEDKTEAIKYCRDNELTFRVQPVPEVNLLHLQLFTK
jgi:hypothetical protein